MLLVLGAGVLACRSSWGHSADATITITATVEAFAEWADAAPVVITSDWSGPLNRMKQQQTVSRTLVLRTNTDTTITPSAGANHGVLTHEGHELATAYQMVGSVKSPDSSFKPAEEFFSAGNRYQVEHSSGTGAYNIVLNVRGSTPADAAPDSGVYMCSVVLTATW